MLPVVVDLDDFCESNHRLPDLDRLKAEIPALKLTLFTIPGLCSSDFLRRVRETRGEWLDLVPHGFLHGSSRECQHWTEAQMRDYLGCVSYLGMTRGWKAPGWQISDASYSVLREAGYWLADQSYNAARRPDGLQIYELESGDALANYRSIHGHVGHMGGHNANELEYIEPAIRAAAGFRFDFVREHLTTWHNKRTS